MTLVLERPEDPEVQLEQWKQLAAAMGRPVMFFMNFDSDFLFVAATDGEKLQHVHVGWIDGDDERMQDSTELSVFDALLKDGAARAEFRRILASKDEERVFSEEAAQEMATLFGYTMEALLVDEDAEPFAVLGFVPGSHQQGGWCTSGKREGRVPLLMPEHAPPALGAVVRHFGNPTSLQICSCGGPGRGVRILLQAEGYDDDEWESPCIWLSNEVNKFCGYAAPEEYGAKVIPKRAVFEDGSKGWLAEFPDVPLLRGVNPASPDRRSAQAQRFLGAGSYRVDIALYEGQFLPRESGGPVQAALPEGDWRERENPSVCAHIDRFVQKTHVWILPMENPDGWMHHTFALVQPQRGQAWLTGYVPEELI